MKNQPPIIYPPELVAELLEWLKPVHKAMPEFIEQMQQYANQLRGTTPRINAYYCPGGHETITVDRAETSAQKTLLCPACQQEARSIFYMCDQGLTPTHEFYHPSDPTAFPRAQRGRLRRGALAFKAIYAKEPSRLSTKIKPKL